MTLAIKVLNMIIEFHILRIEANNKSFILNRSLMPMIPILIATNLFIYSTIINNNKLRKNKNNSSEDT